MTDEEFEKIAQRVHNEPLYTDGWSRETIHQARLDRHALLNEVERLRALAPSIREPSPR